MSDRFMVFVVNPHFLHFALCIFNKPGQAFPYAFNSGADFMCVGMYDFQVVDDVNLALSSLKNIKDRTRPWRASMDSFTHSPIYPFTHSPIYSLVPYIFPRMNSVESVTSKPVSEQGG
jgi:hypothetical protein